MLITGIICALLAMLFWGFGDFLIQRSTRAFGDWETLFIICLVGVVLLFPFVFKSLPAIFLLPKSVLFILLGASLALFAAAFLEFEALRIGKISIIEPIWSIEIAISALLAFLVLKEVLSGSQIFLIISLIIGLFLVSYRGKVFTHRFFLEKGVVISFFAAIIMGATNFLVGWGARETNPLLVNFVISFVSLVGSAIFLIKRKKMGKMFFDLSKNPKHLLVMSVFDNAAWVAFAFALALIPIGIASAISESYIIIAVLLGIFVSREKLQQHQKHGLIVAIVTAIILASQLIY